MVTILLPFGKISDPTIASRTEDLPADWLPITTTRGNSILLPKKLTKEQKFLMKKTLFKNEKDSVRKNLRPIFQFLSITVIEIKSGELYLKFVEL